MLRTVPVSHIAGVGQAKQKCLAALGLFTVYDLLHHFPTRYEDRRILPLESFQDGDRVNVKAVVEGSGNVRWMGRKSTCSAKLRIDQRFVVTGIWFNQPYIKQKLVDGRILVVSGKYSAERGTIVVSHTEFDVGKAPESHTEWMPIYAVTQGLSSEQLRVLVQRALHQFGSQLDDDLPRYLIEKYRLIPHQQAVAFMHQPVSSESLRQAHRRLAFEEFFLFQLQLQWFRRQRDSVEAGTAQNIPEDAFDTFARSLPYRLTSAQTAACHAIAEDLRSALPMSRLLQGDVGSGKTWVAFWGAYAAFRAGYQSAFMAPTEILAEQHYHDASQRLVPLGVRIALLTGGTSTRIREQLLQDIRNHSVDLVIGTHALLTEDVEFASLGFVITDEQHRFGVSQRSVLRSKGFQPDVMFLSATPIPRTLALAIYGDLDVTVLNELPAGRKPVRTSWVQIKDEAKAIRFVRQELSAGRQAYIVAPLIEDSEQLTDVLSATRLAERLKEQFAGFSVQLLHGRMTSRDKDAIMRSFVAGEAQVIVSTTVIEVGIHVPNASVMMIYHAERFGLAQLHQLRGRVGRGSAQSYCILLSDAVSEIAKRRLETMVETNDGFLIAERDLDLRGPGEFLGVRQSGLPEFSVGDLARDFKVMEVARDEAATLVDSSDFWLLPAYQRLREAVEFIPTKSYFKD